MDDLKTPQHVQVEKRLGEETKTDSDGNKIIIRHLKPFDRLVYTFMKKHMDAKTNETFAGIECIADELKVSRNKVSRSVQKLCNCGVIVKCDRKVGRANVYKFIKFIDKFEMFTNKFLEDSNTLTSDEKAVIISLQEYTYQDEETGDSYTTHSLEKLARVMNISTPTLRKTFASLENKGILQSTLSNKIDKVSGTRMTLRRIDNEKLAQAVLFIGKQVVENTNDIAELKELIKEMRLEQNKANEQIRNLQIENKILKDRLNKNPKNPETYEF